MVLEQDQAMIKTNLIDKKHCSVQFSEIQQINSKKEELRLQQCETKKTLIKLLKIKNRN